MLDDIHDPDELRQYLQRLELSMQSVRRRLRRYEDEFGMSSQEFYRRLQNKQLEPRLEYSEWAGEHEMLQRLQKQHDELKRRLGE